MSPNSISVWMDPSEPYDTHYLDTALTSLDKQWRRGGGVLEAP